MSWTKNIITVLVSLTISLFIAEIIFRVFNIGYGNAPLIRSQVYHHVHQSNYEFLMYDPKGEYGGHIVYYDESGFRVPNRDSSVISFKDKKDTIVFLGDSITEGNQVSFKNTFVSRVGDQIDKNVINLGTSSYSPIIYLLQTKNILSSFKADTVIMQVHSNDFQNDISYKKDAILIDKDVVGINSGKKNVLVSLLRKSYVIRFIRKNQLIAKELLNYKNKTLPNIIDTFQWEQRATKAQIINTVNIISEIDKLLTLQGKTLYVFLIPSKALTKTRSCCGADEVYSLFYQFLNDKGVKTINISQAIEKRPIQKDLFFETDIHLTKAGHKFFAETIVKHLSND